MASIRLEAQASSSPSACRRSTRLFQYGGPRPGERRGTSVASPIANMPSTIDAVNRFLDAKILYGPGKAANAGDTLSPT